MWFGNQYVRIMYFPIIQVIDCTVSLSTTHAFCSKYSSSSYSNESNMLGIKCVPTPPLHFLGRLNDGIISSQAGHKDFKLDFYCRLYCQFFFFVHLFTINQSYLVTIFIYIK